jgi:predicted GNAT family acetyltransferase
MIADVDIEREDDGARGRYVIRLPGDAEAELTYGRRGESTLVADHTYVPPEFRGRGLAEKLVGALIGDARREGSKIVPLCSYVAAQFRRNRDWADLHA